MIVFENSGEADLRALTTFGVNVKEGSDPYGFFGTGFKYTLSLLLRNGCNVFLQIGEEEFKVEARETEIRGKSFRVIFLGDKELHFTTEVGKNWKLWMAYRELYCNALDEKKPNIYVSLEKPQPESGKTRIVVDGLQFEEIHRNRSQFILNTEPLYKRNDIELHPGPANAVFLKGIKVRNLPQGKNSLYTINLLSRVSLTEDRTLTYSFEYEYPYQRFVAKSRDEKFIESALLSTYYVERSLSYEGMGEEQLSDSFKKVLQKLYKEFPDQINKSAYNLATNLWSENMLEQTFILSPLQQKMLEKAIAFCEKIGYPVTEYPIVNVRELGGANLALAKGETIYIAEGLYGYGTKFLAAGLIEEYIHLKYAAPDCTRKMQQILFNKIVSMGEEQLGEPL